MFNSFRVSKSIFSGLSRVQKYGSSMFLSKPHVNHVTECGVAGSPNPLSMLES